MPSLTLTPLVPTGLTTSALNAGAYPSSPGAYPGLAYPFQGGISLTLRSTSSLDAVVPKTGLYPHTGLYPSSSDGLMPRTRVAL